MMRYQVFLLMWLFAMDVTEQNPLTQAFIDAQTHVAMDTVTFQCVGENLKLSPHGKTKRYTEHFSGIWKFYADCIGHRECSVRVNMVRDILKLKSGNLTISDYRNILVCIEDSRFHDLEASGSVAIASDAGNYGYILSKGTGYNATISITTGQQVLLYLYYILGTEGYNEEIRIQTEEQCISMNNTKPGLFIWTLQNITISFLSMSGCGQFGIGYLFIDSPAGNRRRRRSSYAGIGIIIQGVVLDPAEYYCQGWQGQTQCIVTSSTKMEDLTMRPSTPTTSNATVYPTNTTIVKAAANAGAIVGGVIGTILLAVAIAILVLFILWRRRIFASPRMPSSKVTPTAPMAVVDHYEEIQLDSNHGYCILTPPHPPSVPPRAEPSELYADSAAVQRDWKVRIDGKPASLILEENALYTTSTMHSGTVDSGVKERLSARTIHSRQ